MQQSELADLSGLSLGHLSRVETGAHICSTEVCAKLAQALGVTPNDLIFEPSKIRISQLRLQHLQKLVKEEHEKLEQLKHLEYLEFVKLYGEQDDQTEAA